MLVLRSIAFLGFNLFIAVLAGDRGLSLEAGGVALSVCNLSGVLASPGLGRIADRVDHKPLICGLLIHSVPFLWAYAALPGPLRFLWLAMGGALLESTTAVMVALAQQAAPGSARLPPPAAGAELGVTRHAARPGLAAARLR